MALVSLALLTGTPLLTDDRMEAAKRDAGAGRC
jgi:hypothetical protein